MHKYTVCTNKIPPKKLRTPHIKSSNLHIHILNQYPWNWVHRQIQVKFQEVNYLEGKAGYFDSRPKHPVKRGSSVREQKKKKRKTEKGLVEAWIQTRPGRTCTKYPLYPFGAARVKHRSIDGDVWIERVVRSFLKARESRGRNWPTKWFANCDQGRVITPSPEKSGGTLINGARGKHRPVRIVTPRHPPSNYVFAIPPAES